ncbi:hypothetical protein [Candidatus Protofrankia datiscae]|uniref:hypothetical protein n=1 Tax=Candidatus Protofrankia datiscae TaxID=2716812 RepID=UPI0005BA700B|nr:hypothetical protein [Candidatus Protofrankia datiscae]
MRPSVPQLLFAATTVAAVIAMPSDVLAGSTSTLSDAPAAAGPAATSPVAGSPAAVGPGATEQTATEATGSVAAAGPARQPAVITAVQRDESSVDEQIAQAVRTSPLLGEVPPGSVEVTDVHVSTVDPAVATARVIPTGGETDPATALLRHSTPPSPRWALAELGTAGVGCDTLNPAVRDDLGLPCEDQPAS